jgi:hypothetical protein
MSEAEIIEVNLSDTPIESEEVVNKIEIPEEVIEAVKESEDAEVVEDVSNLEAPEAPAEDAE